MSACLRYPSFPIFLSLIHSLYSSFLFFTKIRFRYTSRKFISRRFQSSSQKNDTYPFGSDCRSLISVLRFSLSANLAILSSCFILVLYVTPFHLFLTYSIASSSIFDPPSEINGCRNDFSYYLLSAYLFCYISLLFFILTELNPKLELGKDDLRLPIRRQVNPERGRHSHLLAYSLRHDF